MPRMPDARSLGARPIPQANVRVASYQAGQEGAALERLGNAAMQSANVVDETDKRNDLAEAQKAIAELGTYTSEALFNPDSGALNRKGMDAFNLPKTQSEEFARRAAELRSRLSPRAQQAFDLDAATRQQQFMQTINRHVSEQRNSYNTAQNSALVDMSANSAALNFNNPDAVEFNRRAARDAVQAEAMANSWSPEQTAVKLATVDSTIESSVITRQAETGDVLGAYSRYQQAVMSGRLTDVSTLIKMDNYFQTAYPAAKAEDIIRSMSSTAASPAVQNSIATAANRHGVDASVMTRIAVLESNLNPRAANPNSSAKGLFQFIDGTAKQYGLDDPYDVEKSAEAEARMLKDITAQLTGTLGRTPTGAELYLAHQQGAFGASRLLANPDKPASEFVSERAITLNGGTKDMTAGEFARLWESKYNAVSLDQGAQGTGLIDLEAVTQAVARQPQAVQEATIKLAREQNTLRNQQIKQQQDELEAQAVQHIDNGGSLANMPVNILSGMTLESRNRIRTFAEAGSDTKTDPQVYLDLKSQIVAGNAVSLANYRSQLSIADYKSLGELQQSPQEQFQTKLINTVMPQIEPILTAGLERDDKAGQAARVLSFRRRAEDEVAGLAQSLNRVPTQKEVNQVIDTLMLSGTLRTPGGGMLWGDSTRTGARFDAAAGEIFEVEGIPYFEGNKDISGIPMSYSEAMRELSASLSSRGIPVTSENMAAAYEAAIGSGN